MCLNDLSSCELIGLASSLAIFLGENLSSDEVNILAAFVTSLGDNLAIIAATKSDEDSNNNQSKCN